MLRPLAFLLSALVVSPLAIASHLGPTDVNALHLNVLVYHPYPDENGDPWGIPAVDVNGTRVDWMQGTYGAFFYPTAVFDGLVRIDEMSQGEGGGEFQETNATYTAAMQERLQHDSAATIRIAGEVQEHQMRVDVSAWADSALPSNGTLLRIVYFEDDVTYNGGSGVVLHRFVVREERQHAGVALGVDGLRFNETFQLAEAVDPANVGVVVVLQNLDEASSLFERKEVIQAATWSARQRGDTVQSARGVLLELYSATWCTACVVGDAVADNLANAQGLRSARVADADYEYLRPGAWWKVGAVALAAAVVVGWLRRPRGPGAAP